MKNENLYMLSYYVIAALLIGLAYFNFNIGGIPLVILSLVLVYIPIITYIYIVIKTSFLQKVLFILMIIFMILTIYQNIETIVLPIFVSFFVFHSLVYKDEVTNTKKRIFISLFFLVILFLMLGVYITNYFNLIGLIFFGLGIITLLTTLTE
ncbi:hypothetical protein MBCUT_11530 [Methanobrevibacter cuticularis]|uniref:Uncharacterized protein n=1 Tax=Methanobrevibacter cuticularis TaxID=47311 RepID=A0A166CQC7_9EURY|nr:hypothetical protein MBCUT_11530 [Methanobrevibacter cuticularis]